MKNCPHCNSSLEGGFIIDEMRKQCDTEEQAIEYASNYAGWEEHGLANRWGREIGVYDRGLDMTIAWRCPDCEGMWSVFNAGKKLEL